MLLDIIQKGTTDYSCTIRIVDSTDGTPETGVAYDTSGIDLWYRRPAAAHTSITEATQTESGAHTDGGFVHISDGYYRLDLPDAAVASGADYVDVGGTVTGMVVIGGRIRLTSVDLDDSVRAGMTALPNAAPDAAGGLPISDAGGLDLDALDANVTLALADTNELQTDLTNGGRLDLLIDAILEDTGTTLPATLAGLNDLSAAEVNAEVVDALATDTYAELANVPAATSTLSDKINWLFALARNKITQTGTTQTLRNDADAGSIATAAVSDDGTTTTRGEWS